MGVLQNGPNLLAVQSYYQQMAIGGVLVSPYSLINSNSVRDNEYEPLNVSGIEKLWVG